MRTIYTVAAYWSWVPHRARQRVASILLGGGFVLLLSRGAMSFGPLATPLTPQVPLLGRIRLGFDLAGVAFAIWARLTLGGNWSGIITVKRHRDLDAVSDEDALMAEEFPDAHRTYRARTKALIPFVW